MGGGGGGGVGGGGGGGGGGGFGGWGGVCGGGGGGGGGLAELRSARKNTERERLEISGRYRIMVNNVPPLEKDIQKGTRVRKKL